MNIETIMILKDILVILLISAGILMIIAFFYRGIRNGNNRLYLYRSKFGINNNINSNMGGLKNV